MLNNNARLGSITVVGKVTTTIILTAYYSKYHVDLLLEGYSLVCRL